MMTMGEHMRAAREAAELSLNELSVISGINVDVIWRTETNKSFPNVLNVIALADALGIGIDEYIGHVPKKG